MTGSFLESLRKRKNKRIVRALGEFPPGAWLTHRGQAILEKERQKLVKLEQQVFPSNVQSLRIYRNISGYSLKIASSNDLPWC
jgi:hypothetical protein